MESATVTLDLARRRAVLRIEKSQGRGGLVKLADFHVTLDGTTFLKVCDVNVLPDLGVALGVHRTRVLLRRFVHRGAPTDVPEFLHVGGWQMLNRPSVADNLDSICRGVVRAAERKLRRFIKDVGNAPYVVVGLPVWESVPGHRRRKTRYNVSRVFDPDGDAVFTGPEIHSCETEFWHGFGVNEFDVYGAPVSMHVCHDGRYPKTWTLSVMFGARLVLHPSNGGTVRGGIDAFESGSGRATSTSHASTCVSTVAAGAAWSGRLRSVCSLPTPDCTTPSGTGPPAPSGHRRRPLRPMCPSTAPVAGRAREHLRG